MAGGRSEHLISIQGSRLFNASYDTSVVLALLRLSLFLSILARSGSRIAFFRIKTIAIT